MKILLPVLMYVKGEESLVSLKLILRGENEENKERMFFKSLAIIEGRVHSCIYYLPNFKQVITHQKKEKCWYWAHNKIEHVF